MIINVFALKGGAGAGIEIYDLVNVAELYNKEEKINDF
jgi:hypothetical protein